MDFDINASVCVGNNSYTLPKGIFPKKAECVTTLNGENKGRHPNTPIKAYQYTIQRNPLFL